MDHPIAGSKAVVDDIPGSMAKPLKEMSDEDLYALWVAVRELKEDPESEKLKQGKRAAGLLFQRYFDRIHAYFRKRLGDDVQDVVSEALQTAIYGNFRSDGAFRSFVFGVAHKRLLKEYKKRSKNDRFDPSVSSLNDLGPSITYVMDKNKVRGLVAEALRRIPIINQQAIELYFIEGLTGPEVAERTEIKLPTLRSRLRRGLDQVQAEIANMEATREEHDAGFAAIDAWAASLGPVDDDPATGA